jgi:hypothetical protein
LPDAWSIPHYGTLGGTTAYLFENRVMLAAIIPCPTIHALERGIQFCVRRGQSVQHYLAEIRPPSIEHRLEAFRHETHHIEQIESGYLWGTVAAVPMVQQVFRTAGIPKSQQSSVLSRGLWAVDPYRTVSQAEERAATLIAELGAHRFCAQSAPKRCHIAGRVFNAIEHSLHERGTSSCRRFIASQLEEWQRCISGTMYDVGSAYEAALAASWIDEQGRIY